MGIVEKNRRVLFEAWAIKQKDRNGLPYFVFTRPGTRDYICDMTTRAFQAFNAALDAVEINFPQEEHYWPHDYCGAVEDCRDAIEKTGLGLKVK